MPLGAFRINTLGKSQAVAGPTTFEAVEFDGTDTLRYQDVTNGLAADSSNILFSGWVKFDTADSPERTNMFIGQEAGSKVIIFTSLSGSDRKFYVYCRNSGGTTIWQVQTQFGIWDGEWHHVMGSWNGTTGHLYVDGVSDMVENTNTSGNINWSCQDWGVGSNRYDGLEGGPCHVAELYLTNEYLDLSSSTNRDKFYNSTTGGPVDLGSDGSTPTGTQPLIYFTGEASTWNAGTNAGSTTGWGMDIGAVTDSDQEPVERSDGLEAIEYNLVKAPGDNNISTQPASATGEFTLAFWFKHGPNTENAQILNLNEGQSGALGNALLFVECYKGGWRVGYRDSTNTFRMDMIWSKDKTASPYESAYGNGFWDGEWHHMVMSATTANPGITLYIDGVQKTDWIDNGSRSAAGNKSEFNLFDSFNLISNWDGYQPGDQSYVTQLWLDDTAIDLSTNISKFYDNGAVDMGTDGTGSGLSQPLIFHTGDGTDFFTKGGDTSSFNYTVTKDTTSGDAIDVDQYNGPILG